MELIKKGEVGKTSPLVVLIILGVLVSGIFFIFRPGFVQEVIIKDQATNEILFAKAVKPSSIITYGWIHSFEHIPWTEEFVIKEDNILLLRKITVAGYGAGIPNNKGIVSIDHNGIITMDEINEEYESINWINSTTALEYISINDEVVVIGEELPHHESLGLEIKRSVKLWQK